MPDVAIELHVDDVAGVGAHCFWVLGNLSANRFFATYDAILDAGCDAWNKLIAQPETILSIGTRDWAHTGQ